MAGFWGKRKREQEAAQQAQDDDLAKNARTALVEADERIRSTADELIFAEAELGTGPTRELREALDAVRSHMGEAFQLHQLNHDDIPDTPEELRTRNARIVQLCEWAQELLDDRTGALAEAVATVRRAPEILAGVRRDAQRLQERLPVAREVTTRLAARYAPSALARVAHNADEAEQVLEFAVHSAEVSLRRRESGRVEEANLALETATESIRRAAALIDGIEDFEIEALRAQSTLGDVIADSRADLVALRDAPTSPAVADAAARLEQALAALPSAGDKSDPFAQLASLREANSALDAAVAAARERAARPLPTIEQTRHAVDDADRQISVARSVISGHRGYIGADARTRLAEAERVRADIDALPSDEDSREQAVSLARRASYLASEALQLAQRDIDSSRPPGGYDGWGGGRRGGMSGGDMMGGLIGGAILGGILGDMFD